MKLVLLVLLAMPCVASAQVVYKCVGAGGATVYQDEPCPQGARIDKAWDGAVHQTTPEQQRLNDERIRHAERALAARRAQNAGSVVSYAPSAPTASEVRHARCEAAKAQVAAWERQRGLRRTLEDLRRWGDYQYQQCK